MTGDRGHQVRVVLLRHGQVPNHRSDVPPTELGLAQADAAGRWFASEGIDIAALLSGETRRTIETATAFATGCRDAGGAVPDPVVSFALRNPDLHLGGHRVNMGEGAAFLASQVPEVDETAVEASTFYRGFLTAPDRIGYWLAHGNPPGESAPDVGRRIAAFARSLVDVPAWAGRTVVAITHSPVLRAVRRHHWGDYSQEPPFLHGYALGVAHSGDLSLETFVTGTGDLPVTAKPGPGTMSSDPVEPDRSDQREEERR
ncbi:MAG: phosphoglycerate mutase family protein [Actinomycetota bacterium]